MAVDTVNYDQSLEELIRGPIRHLWKVTVTSVPYAPFSLEVEEELSVAFSLAWSPYAQASLKVKTPTDPVKLQVLDGRIRTYVRLDLGYSLNGSGVSINEAVSLRIQDAEEDILSGTITLTLQGREMEAQDAPWFAEWAGLMPRGGVKEAIEYVLSQSMNGSVTVTGTGTGHRPDLVADVNPSTGTDLWSIAAGIANSAGLKLWHDGGQTWKLLPRYNTTGATYATMLRTGRRGTVSSIKRRLSRSEWFNEVIVEYPDSLQSNGTPVRGIAQISGGPFGYTNVGVKAHTVSVKGWANSDSANAAARALLTTLSARGSSYTIQAVAAYWIRPGMTVPVKTGRGPYEKQVVESVTFTPLNGLMTITTIKNEDVTIS